MSVSASCPGCHTTFRLPDNLAGKKVRCKNCARSFVVAGDAGADAAGATLEDIALEENPAGISARSAARRLRDEKYKQDDIDPAEAARQAEQRKKLMVGAAIGGVALLFVILLMAGINALKDEDRKGAKVDKPIAPAPIQAPVPTAPVVPKVATVQTPTAPGPERTLTINIPDIIDEATRQEITKKLNTLAEGNPTVKTSRSAKGTVATVAPVDDANAYAKKLAAYARVKVEGRVIDLMPRLPDTVAIPRGATVRSVTPPPGILEPPDAPEERPADVPAPAVWKVKADPPDKPTKGVGRMARPLAFGRDQKVIYPSTPSPWVAVAGSAGGGYVATPLSLQTLKYGKKLTVPNGLSEPLALSADGTHLAGRPAAGGPAAVEVWTFAGVKPVRQITADAGLAEVELVDFLPANQLLVMTHAANKRKLQIWDIAKGDKMREWAGPATYVPKSAAMSPGRKFLAVGEGEKLWVYDLSVGAVAAEVNMPRGQRDLLKPECNGLAFSPDGSELAGIFETPFRSRILSWDVGRGKVVADHVFDRKLRWEYKGRPLEWMLGHNAWLVYGKTFIEHDTGKLVLELPNGDADRELHVVPRDRLLEVVYSLRGNALSTGSLATDQLEPMVESTRKVWGAVLLPPARAGDLATAQTVALPPDTTGLQIDPDGRGSRGNAEAVRMSIAQRDADIQKILFSRPDLNQVAVVSAVQPDQLFTKKVLRVDRYDLASHKPIGTTNLCVDAPSRFWEKSLPADLAPDGTALVMKGRQDRRRVDVWSLTDNRHLAGWQPYAKEQGDPKTRPDSVAWVGFADARRVLTLNPTGKLVMWSAPDAKAVYVLPGVVPGSVALSPGRKYLAVLQENAFYLYVAATGDAAGRLPWPTPLEAGVPVTAAAAFSPDGDQLAACVAGHVICWDLKTGKETASFPTGQEFYDLAWCGAEALIGHAEPNRGTHYLIDIPGQVVLCAYQAPGVPVATAVGPDGRFWLPQTIAQQTQLIALLLPETRGSQVAQMVRDPNSPTALKSGSKVGIVLDLRGAPDAVRQSVLEQLCARMRAVGLEPAEGQSVVLTFRATLADTGRTLQYRFFGTNTAVTVPVQRLTCNATLGEWQKQWWHHDCPPVETSGALIERAGAGDNLADRVTEQLWQSVAYLAGSLPVPGRVYLMAGNYTTLPVTIPLPDLQLGTGIFPPGRGGMPIQGGPPGSSGTPQAPRPYNIPGRGQPPSPRQPN